MGRVFLMCVGTRDPYWFKIDTKTKYCYDLLNDKDNKNRQQGPILTFFDWLYSKRANHLTNEDKVYLFSTSNKNTNRVKHATDDCADWIIDEIHKKFGNSITIKKKTMYDKDPSSFWEIFEEMKGKLTGILAGCNSQDTYNILISPGTAQMKAFWLLATDVGLIKNALVYQANEFTNKVSQVRIDSLFEVEQRKNIIRLMKKLNLLSAAETLKTLSSGGYNDTNKRAYEIYSYLCYAYYNWLSFKYNESCQNLENAINKINNLNQFGEIQTKINEQKNVMEDLESRQSANVVNVLHSLYSSAEIRFHQGNYTACIWRLYAVVEKIRRGYQMDKLVKEGVIDLPENDRQRKGYHFDMNAAYKHLDNNNLLFDGEVEEKIRKIKDLRNATIHQLEPVDDTTAIENLEYMTSIFSAFFTKYDIRHSPVENFSFNYIKIKKVLDAFESLTL